MTRRLALLIGNNEYTSDSGLSRLIKAENDVRGLANVLADPTLGRFEITEDKILLNRHKNDIDIAIESFFHANKSDDLLLFYFAGHGMLDAQGKLYLAASNTIKNRLMSTAVSASFIAELMNESSSKRQIVILDCCHSGAFIRGIRAITGSSVGTKTIFKADRQQRARVVITATDATQFAFEEDGSISDLISSNNSLFTQFLIRGIQTGDADRDNDGEITHDELFDYISDSVVEKTKNQTPKMWVYDYQGRLTIAYRSSENDLFPLKNPLAERDNEANPIKQERVIEHDKNLNDTINAILAQDESEIYIDQALEIIRDFLHERPTRRGRIQEIEMSIQCLFNNNPPSARAFLNKIINGGLLEEVRTPGMFQLSEKARSRLSYRR